MNFHIFPLLWDEFLRQLERPMLDWLRGKEISKTLSQIYWQTGWNYWKGNGGGGAWTAQLEAVFFENRHFRTIKQLYDYPKLNALAEQSLQEVSSKKPEERYRQAVKPHLDQRKEELLRTSCYGRQRSRGRFCIL